MISKKNLFTLGEIFTCEVIGYFIFISILLANGVQVNTIQLGIWLSFGFAIAAAHMLTRLIGKSEHDRGCLHDMGG